MAEISRGLLATSVFPRLWQFACFKVESFVVLCEICILKAVRLILDTKIKRACSRVKHFPDTLAKQ